MDSNYFVYVYYDTRYIYKANTIINCKHLPIYVGKGKNNRHLAHMKKANNIFLRKYIETMENEGTQPIVEQVAFFDDEKEAYKFENDLIEDFGIIYDLSGSLFNKTRGNDIFCDTYDKDYRKLLMKEYKNLILSGECVEWYSKPEPILMTEKVETKPTPRPVKHKVYENLELSDFIVTQLKKYIKIGMNITECCSIFDIEEKHIKYNISKCYLHKWIV